MNAKHLSIAALVFLSCGPLTELERCHSGQVVASLSSVTLASDCGAQAKGAADFAAGACAEGTPCPSLCRQSSMQLSFVSTGPGVASVEIRAVRLFDSNRKLLQTLTSREPQHWSADQYLAWNQQVLGGETVKATYKLSAPTYYYGADARSSYQAYTVEVDVAIDGEVRTLQTQATREPEVAT